MYIENVDWQITSCCNRMCPYCFGPIDTENMSFGEAKKSVDILETLGVKQIGITGGEPLLYPHISELITYIFTKGIRIYLSSNCDYYGEFAQLIKDKVSILGVPVDGPTSVVHDSIRGEGSFQNVTEAIDDIIHSNCATRIKVGTVLNNRNQSRLGDIERLLGRYQEKLIFWKIYELIMYSRNRDTAHLLKTSHLVDMDCLGNYVDRKKIILDTIEERDRSYFFLKPNGDVFVPALKQENSEEIPLGNLLQNDAKEINCLFNGIVNRSGYYKSFRYMRNSVERR